MKCSMKIVQVFIIGMLCCTSAQNYDRGLAAFSRALIEIMKRMSLIKAKCHENGGIAAFSAAYNASENFKKCCHTNFSGRTFAAELEEAENKQTGEIRTIYKKYCEMIPGLKKCFFEHDAAILPCLEEKERQHQRISLNMINAILDYICADVASSMTQFHVAGGLDCIQNNSEELERCFNFNVKAVDETNILLRWPYMFNIDKCAALSEIQDCVVIGLQVCGDTVPFDVVDSFFNSARRVIPCVH